jgi:predicted kinase
MSTELVVLVGESGSGKSTLAKEMVANRNGKAIRLNRDELRLMLHNNKIDKRTMENHVIALQRSMARESLLAGYTVVIDDTNLNERTRERWADLASSVRATSREHRMGTSLSACIQRDSLRKAKVGAPVIFRQFLESGRFPISGRPIVIVDVDGTVADSEGVRSPYDESKVEYDKPYQVVIDWVRALSEDHDIYIVSGRHSSCGVGTTYWLMDHGVPYDAIFMRHAWDNRADTVVKKEILDALLKLVPKERIAFVLDDRPKVIRMWKENGLRVFPVRGAVEEF